MKRSLLIGLSAVLMVPMVTTTIVFAESSNSGATNTTTSTTNTSTPTNSTNQTSNTNPSSSDNKDLETRITARKTELKLKLTVAQETRLKTKCKASQGLISSIQAKLDGVVTDRQQAYTDIINNLTDLSTKLKNKGVNTTQFDTDLTTLKADITTFNTDLATYKQDVSDLATMDCVSDPDGFQASLQTARTDLQKVATDATAIRTYLTDTVKTLLQQIKQQLEGNNSTSNSSSTGTTGGTH